MTPSGKINCYTNSFLFTLPVQQWDKENTGYAKDVDKSQKKAFGEWKTVICFKL